eukprot:g3580.t1
MAAKAHAADRYAHLRACWGDALFEKVTSSRLLVVGAGGIGCELLKNLVMSGFGTGASGLIEVVDLDTIDVSNLNRQFLFRKHHVGQPKATVAKESVSRFNPEAAKQIVALQDNVITNKRRFNAETISGFDLVLNALDNVKARTHVNRLCVSQKVPLIESGTTGFLGQVQVIEGGVTQCYDCTPKPKQKVYPLCTVADLPRKPVHCIEWAKECHKLVFGARADSRLFEGNQETGELDASSAYMAAVAAPPAAAVAAADAGDRAPLRAHARAAFDALFARQIERKLAINEGEAYKNLTCPPTPMEAAVVCASDGPGAAAAAEAEAAGAGADTDEDDDANGGGGGGGGGEDGARRAWSPAESTRAFCAAIVRFWADPLLRTAAGSAEFDKDDAHAMRFVAAASNLRAGQFGIAGGVQSLHDAKGMAGNIIPAIATTNAIVAGLQVKEALTVLRNRVKAEQAAAPILAAAAPLSAGCKFTWVRSHPDGRGALLSATSLDPPNPECIVSGTAARDGKPLTLDTHRMTLQALVDVVLCGDLGLEAPCVAVGDRQVLEMGDDAEEALRVNLPKTLAELGVGNATEVSVDDFSQEVEVSLLVYHREAGAPAPAPAPAKR